LIRKLLYINVFVLLKSFILHVENSFKKAYSCLFFRKMENPLRCFSLSKLYYLNQYKQKTQSKRNEKMLDFLIILNSYVKYVIKFCIYLLKKLLFIYIMNFLVLLRLLHLVVIYFTKFFLIIFFSVLSASSN